MRRYADLTQSDKDGIISINITIKHLRKDKPMQKIRRHMIFYGHVQGVGFRYTSYYNARNYGISGWVRNLDDGSVEMEAEGEIHAVDEFVSSLYDLRWGNVERIESKDIPVHGDYGFEII
jgi:acylphosphatase